MERDSSAIRKPASCMVAFSSISPGENQICQGGVTHQLWLPVFLLFCCLVVIQPGSPRLPVISTGKEVKYWLYKQDGWTTSAQNSTAEVLVVGDIMLGRGVAQFDDPFNKVSQFLALADLTVGNFEGVISSQESVSETQKEQSGSIPYRLVAPSRSAVQLHDASFDLLSLANNHSLDTGELGLTESIERLRGVGIKTIGVGDNIETAYRPVTMIVKGLRIAFLAIDAIPEPISIRDTELELKRATWNKDRVLEIIRRLDPASDAIIVLIHWGDEYEVRAGPNQRLAGLEMVEAGADAIIGSHPHVVQETQMVEKIDQKKNGFVAYSLGNFVFDQFGENTRVGLALKLFIDTSGLKAVEAIPIQAGPIPEILSLAESQDLMGHIRPEPVWVSFRCNPISCYSVQTGLVGGSGLFKSGRIDLNGNGIPEIVRLENGRISVYEDDLLEWESPQEWHVLDAALGDPNDDGRGEIMLALQKLDSKGVLASHPFLIGHRGGVYRQLWGGSALTIPIREVDLADVDGDGKQELVVLEVQPDGMKTIAVLRWDDWVFRLFWRSVPGKFVDLQVRATGENQKVITIAQIR